MESPSKSKSEEVRAQLKKLTQQTLKEALEAELEEFLSYPKSTGVPPHPTNATETNPRLSEFTQRE